MTRRDQRSRAVAIAQDTRRERAFRHARLNSIYVRTLRVVFPLAAIGLIGLYGFNLAGNVLLSQISNGETGQIKFESAEVSADGFGMANPRYEGFNPDGSRFVVTAKRAITGLKVDGPIRLETIEGQIFGLDNAVTRLMATRGTYDQKAGKLTLNDGILIQTSDGMTARLVSARVEPKTGNIRSDEPVEVQMPAATVAGRQFVANQKTRVVVFDRGVVAHLKPEQVNGAAATKSPASAQKPATGFQVGSNEPIRVTAKTLEVRDAENQAVFSTNVVAVQSTGQLAADKLTVRYTPAPPKSASNAAAIPGGAASVGGNRQVEQLVAEKGVRLTQGTDTITSSRAVFQPAANTADFSGGVTVISAETQITATTMFVDQTKSVATLEGGVNVNQGRNTLSGHRLTIDQTTGRLMLIAPPAGGLISTRFYRDAVPGAAQKTPQAKSSAGARPSPFSFETDPNAPIDVKSRQLEVHDSRKTAVYRGNVTAQQGVFNINADVLTANYTGSTGLAGLTPGAPRTLPAGTGPELSKLVAEGGVTITSSPTRKAKGKRASYDVKRETLTLLGDVTVIDGRQILQGESLTIDMRTGLSSLQSARSGVGVAEAGKKPSRMRAVFFPSDLQNARNQRKDGGSKPEDSGGWSSRTSSPSEARAN